MGTAALTAALVIVLQQGGAGPGVAEGLRYREQPAADEGARARVVAVPAGERTPRRITQRRAPNDTGSWLPDWVVAIAEAVAPPAPQPRRVAQPRPARPAGLATALRPSVVSAPVVSRPAAIETLPAGRVGTAATRTREQTIEAIPTPLPPQPFVTGALPVPPVAAPAQPEPHAVPAETPAARVHAIELEKARRDLVKLELSSRVYSERRLAGQRVFATASDWIVLEHANEAMHEPEWAAAVASGFAAVTYINDVERVVVVAIAGTQDLKRDFLANDVWQALIRAEAPQQFFFATQYVKSVKRRYLSAGYTIECVGHSLGGGACAYAAADIGIEARVINPISAGRLDPRHAHMITNYVVDGEIANLVYGARGNVLSGQVHVISDRNDKAARERIVERWGRLGGIAVVIDELRGAIDGHRVDAALDKIARMAETSRPRALLP
jgi:hypothetical protein